NWTPLTCSLSAHINRSHGRHGGPSHVLAKVHIVDCSMGGLWTDGQPRLPCSVDARSAVRFARNRDEASTLSQSCQIERRTDAPPNQHGEKIIKPPPTRRRAPRDTTEDEAEV